MRKVYHLLVILAAFSHEATAAFGQNEPTRSGHDSFGDIFSHPRDKQYLPGTAPSRGVLVGEGKYHDDLRGNVGVLEYKSGEQVIRREVWTKDNGDPTGRLSIGGRF